MYACIYIHLVKNIYVSIYICLYIYVYMVHIHAYMHTHELASLTWESRSAPKLLKAMSHVTELNKRVAEHWAFVHQARPSHN